MNGHILLTRVESEREARLIKFMAVTYIDFISNIKHHELCLIGLQLHRDIVSIISRLLHLTKVVTEDSQGYSL